MPKTNKTLIKPSFYTSDIRTNKGIVAYILERFGLCLVTSEDEIYLIKDRHAPRYGPYSPSELHQITTTELSDIPKLEKTFQELAKKRKTWLRPDHITDLNRGIEYLDLDCTIDSNTVFNNI